MHHEEMQHLMMEEKVALEALEVEAMERRAQEFEKQEMELIARLRRMQEMQINAFAELEDVLEGSPTSSRNSSL